MIWRVGGYRSYGESSKLIYVGNGVACLFSAIRGFHREKLSLAIFGFISTKERREKYRVRKLQVSLG